MAELVSTMCRPSALAIYAHPDDPDVSCGGTLAAWAKAGCVVRVVMCTDGGKGSADPTVVPEELAARRAVETAEAGAVLGVAEQYWLDYPDGELTNSAELREALVAAVRRFRPDVVLCPDPTAIFFGQDYFNHRDHRVTGMAALDAVSPAAGLPHYFPAAGPAHQVSDGPAVGNLGARRLGGRLRHHRRQGAGGRLPPEPVPRRRGVGVDGRYGSAPRTPGAGPGSAFAEGFRRLRLGA